MNIRWRLSVMGAQLVVLAGITFLITGKPYSNEIWFFAGLLSIVINPQLLEPYYPRPPDVIANSLIFFVLYALAPKTITGIGWNLGALIFVVALILAVIALVMGASRKEDKFSGLARFAKTMSQTASARVIYSTVFFLSVLESNPDLNDDFWRLIVAWVVIMFIGRINWQSAWSLSFRKPVFCKIEGMIGPTNIIISAPDLPHPGSQITFKMDSTEIIGSVINRIYRFDDAWGQIYVEDHKACENLLRERSILIQEHKIINTNFIGCADVGSNERKLRFYATRDLEIGHVVGVKLYDPGVFVQYQLSSAEIQRSDIKRGAHLIVRADASQLGIFRPDTLRFTRHGWVPPPGAAVMTDTIKYLSSSVSVPDTWILLGDVIGTEIPIFLDCETACEGHLTILGMTKMGKTTLAVRLANTLASKRKVIILDQTGEYVNKRGMLHRREEEDWNSPGISVIEPKLGSVAPDEALGTLKTIVGIAQEEYKKGTPTPRTLIIDEAHQFLPEPTGLGFNAPGRDSAYKFGILMMQIRKFGISVILISQRTAVVAKSALSQCENIIAFRSVDQTGLDYLEAIAGSEFRSLLPQLKQGEAMVFGPAMSSEAPVAIKVCQ